MTWIDVLHNPQSLLTLYSSLDDLETLDLHEIVLRRNGPQLLVRADLCRFPERPARGWHADANRVQVTLSLLLTRIMIGSWSTRNVCTFHARRETSEEIAFQLVGESVRIEGTCAQVRVESVSAYESDDDTS